MGRAQFLPGAPRAPATAMQYGVPAILATKAPVSRGRVGPCR